MKKTYAAARLLEHGPLTMGELIEVTGWSRRTCEWVMEELMAMGMVAIDRVNATRARYRLAA